eukprot:2009835-Rhodomonas_salina.1
MRAHVRKDCRRRGSRAHRERGSPASATHPWHVRFALAFTAMCIRHPKMRHINYRWGLEVEVRVGPGERPRRMA